MKRYNVIPALLLIYLAVMCYIGRGEFFAGHYLYYFGIIATTVACIIALRFFLKRRDKLRREREDDMRNSNPKS